jgi:hypothetical protein
MEKKIYTHSTQSASQPGSQHTEKVFHFPRIHSSVVCNRSGKFHSIKLKKKNHLYNRQKKKKLFMLSHLQREFLISTPHQE